MEGGLSEPAVAGGVDLAGHGEVAFETLGSGAADAPSTWPLLRVLPGTRSPSPPPGASLGPYRLLRVLGRGGMGVVYLAHEAPPIQRLVAIKVLRSTSGSRRLRKRLETEVRALARLSHPNIAQVFAAGHTGEGSPYFALEYVPGLRIDEYCNQERLSVERRLDLFLQLCRGVGYAHGRGVLHRDLKPSNVLVTEIEGRPLVKVIDFSIAASLVPSDAQSAPTGVAGTPGYMSPEARRPEGPTADPRSDVYSLGVVLYLLLSGVRPFPREAGSAEALERKQPREVPPAPSRRVGDLPLVARENLAEKRRHKGPRQLARRLRGDLDAIVLRAMDPVRSRRYGSVRELVDDVERHLAAEPVRARPLTWRYRTSRLVRRNPGRLVAYLALLLGLGALFGVGGYLETLHVSARRTTVQLAAERRAGELLEELFAGADGPPAVASTRHALDAARRRAERLVEEPVPQARLLQILGRVYHARHLHADAADLLEKALRLHETTLGPDSLEAAETTADLCHLYGDQARYSQAVAACERSLAIYRTALDDDDSRVAAGLGLLAHAIERSGSPTRALELYESAVVLRRRHLPTAPEALADALEAQAGFHLRQGQLDAAQRLLEEALHLQLEMRGGDDPQLALRREALAAVHARKGDLERARVEYLHALQVLERAGGLETRRAMIHVRLARLDLVSRRDREAERRTRQALEMLAGRVPPSHPSVAEVHVLLSGILRRAGDLEGAARHAETALAATRDSFGTHHPETALAELAAGDVAAAAGRLAAARRHYETALAPLRQFRPAAPETAGALSRLGSVLRREGLTAQARSLYQEALSILEGLQGLPQLEASAVLGELGRLARSEGDGPEASRLLERALVLRVALVGASDPEALSLRRELDELARGSHSSTS